MPVGTKFFLQKRTIEFPQVGHGGEARRGIAVFWNQLKSFLFAKRESKRILSFHGNLKKLVFTTPEEKYVVSE